MCSIRLEYNLVFDNNNSCKTRIVGLKEERERER